MKKILVIVIFLLIFGIGGYFILQPEIQPKTQLTGDSIQPSLPDLVITDVIITKVRKKAPNIYSSDFIVTIQNKGSKDVTESFTVCMWDDKYRAVSKNKCNNGRLANYDHEKMESAILTVNSKVEVVFESINLSTPGQKYYFAVDKSNDQSDNTASDNSVHELDETNNSYDIIFNVEE